MDEVIDLGTTSLIEAIVSWVPLAATRALDIGCGSLQLAAQLSQHCDHVLGIDPYPSDGQAAVLKSHPQVSFARGSGNSIPAAANAFDLVVMAYSLHHVPLGERRRTFDEIDRVLRPSGTLCVLSPANCAFWRLLNLFYDEAELVATADAELLEFGKRAFQSKKLGRLTRHAKYESFETFAQHFAAQAFGGLYTEADVRAEKVRSAFEQFAPAYEFRVTQNLVVLQR